MDEQQLLQQVIQLVLAAQSGDQKAQLTLQQIMLAAQLGNPQAQLIAQMIQNVIQSAKFGAKLNYLKFLKGKCPDGYEMKSFKNGGPICQRCIKKEENGGDVISAFKCGRKMKKASLGTKTTLIEKCGGKTKKK